MRKLFINIDTTFCSIKSLMSSGKVPFELTEENRNCFDWISVGLIKKICANRDIKIVAFSNFNYQNIPEYFGLDIESVIQNKNRVITESGFSLELSDTFESMVGLWIYNNNYVGDYLLLDSAQKAKYLSYIHFIPIDAQEGFLFKNYKQICEYFSIPE